MTRAPGPSEEPTRSRRARWLPAALRLPRRTVRLRLTLLYGGLFLISAAGLLTLNYALVSHATQGAISYQGANGLSGTVDGLTGGQRPQQRAEGGPQLSAAEMDKLDQAIQREQARAIRQRADNMNALLAQSGVALAVMAVVSVALGWIIAGRILGRLRTVTTAARDISATDLHRRLALPGPDDELKELGDTFDELLARLESSFQAHRQFIANVSHELRTPLARQRVLSQLAVSDPDATLDSLKEAHQRVLVAGSQQERVIEALLTLARSQGGFETREPFDLAAITDQVLITRAPEAESRSLTLHTNLTSAPTSGDPRLAERLITNLIDNALRHNHPHGTLEIVTTMDGRSPVIRVTNTGPKIPESDLNRLFKPFQRLGCERTSRVEGLGLGLSIVQAIAEAHHATIDARPRPAGGLSVQVTFPAPVPSRTQRPPAHV
ncbi:HAMP domain-containing sensor histidine kinase [Sphaerisporangium sp. B11E5]|uniref:sensor histidine kinase n=1 Tax=Sphaerisporangium sp. B11E5 TaxID=3153563 RepID=UPI00325E7CB2